MSSTPPILATKHENALAIEESPKSKSCTLGRSFKKIADLTIQVSKVALVFGLVVGACLLQIAPAIALAYNATHPIGYSPLPTTAPSISPLMRTATYMTPGQRLARSSTAACSITEHLFQQDECEQITTQALAHYLYNATNPAEHFTRVELETAHKQGLSRNITTLNGIKIPLTFFLRQKHAVNYENALKYGQWAFIQDAHAFQISEEYTLRHIKTLHSILTDSECQLSQAANTYMKELVHYLHERMKKGGDYIEHAAFFHTVLLRISPYMEGTKKLARLMTQIILLTGDHHPVVFHSDELYKKAVEESAGNYEIFAAFLRAQLEWTRRYVTDVDDPVNRRVINEARYMNPGIQLVNIGREACALGSTPDKIDACQKEVLKQLIWLDSEKILDRRETLDSFNEKGVVLTIVIDNIIKKMHFRINPDKHTNYKNALHFIDYATIENPHLLEESPEQTIEFIKEVHMILMDRLESEEPLYLGKYRTSFMIIDGIGKPELLLARGKERLSHYDFILFKESIVKIQQDVTHLGRLSDVEKIIWNLIAHIPPSPATIEAEMHSFAQQLKTKLCNTPKDPIKILDIASWTHSELARIYPYPDGNGRLARIMMNTILRLGGQKPIVFSSDNEYSEATGLGVKSYTTFTLYLQKMRTWNEQYIKI